jgi:hypothetical protein
VACSILCPLLWLFIHVTPQGMGTIQMGAGDGALTWTGPGSAIWLGQATAKVPSAVLGSLEGRLPAELSAG